MRRGVAEEMNRIEVYLDGFPFFYRKSNSDWSYTENKMPKVAEWAPDIGFIRQKSRRVTLRANLKALRTSVGRRIGFPISRKEADTDHLDVQELARSGCNVVFSHRGFPMNCEEIPVIWMNAVVDPEMTKSYFKLSQEAMDEEVAVKREL